MKFGRNRPKIRGRALSLCNYMPRSYALPPLIGDYTPAAMAALTQMYLNDSEGDCVIAGMGHAEGVFSGNVAGSPVIFTDAQINAMYGVVGGFVPGDPSTDQGCDEETALRIWETQGFAGRKPVGGWMRVNGADPTEVRAAIYEFGNLMCGVELPDSWTANMPHAWGQTTWDVAGDPDENQGHCMFAFNYKPGLVGFSTWGSLVWITDAAIAKYMTTAGQGELYCVVTQEWVNGAGKSPTGLDWTQLLADLQAMGGSTTPPTG